MKQVLRMYPRIVTVLFLVVILLCPSRSFGRARIGEALSAELAVSPPDRPLSIFITFRHPIDYSALRLLTRGMTPFEKRDYVRDYLKQRLESTAGAPIRWLRGEVARGNASHIYPIWLANTCSARLRADLVHRLARFEEIESIVYDPPVPADRVLGEAPVAENPVVPMQSSWGNDSLHAHPLWNRGWTGEGILIGVIDTGIDLDHPALENQIWVNPGEIPDNGIDDDDNGYIDDIHGWNLVDNNGNVEDAHNGSHGTKSAGILVGNGIGYIDTTGVAPDATVMVVRNWGRPGTNEPWHDAALQYLADNGARVISSSMSFSIIEGPEEVDISHRSTLEGLLEMGVICTNSQGNNGTGGFPYNINRPANCPPPWLHPDQLPQGGTTAMMAIGAYNSNGTISGLSSRGPTVWDDDIFDPHDYSDYPWDPENGDYGLLKPDLTSPTGCTSTIRGGGYDTFTGESCASPNAAGALALVRSVHRTATVEEVCEAVKMSACDEGEEGHDNTWGAGRIWIDAADEYLDSLLEYGDLEVRVLNILGGPIAGALVELAGWEIADSTGEDGTVTFERIRRYPYTIEVSAEYHRPVTVDSVWTEPDTVTVLTVTLAADGIDIRPDSAEVDLPAAPDTASVPYDIGGEEEEFRLAGRLVAETCGDWLADDSLELETGEADEYRAGTVFDDAFLAVVHDGEMERDCFVRYDFRGEEIERFEPDLPFDYSGITDFAILDDTLLVAVNSFNAYLLDREFECRDSLDFRDYAPDAIAFSPERESWFLHSTGEDYIVEADPDGDLVAEYPVPRELITGLTWRPSDGEEEEESGLYSASLSPENEALITTIHRLYPVSGEFSEVVSFPSGRTVDLFIDRIAGRPVSRLATVDSTARLDFFDLALDSRCWSLPDTITVPVEGAAADLVLYGEFFVPEDTFHLAMHWFHIGDLRVYRTPVKINVVEMFVVAGHRDHSPLPEYISLGKPWPNPFNSVVRLEYSLPQAGEVRITVYNLLGREVATLVKERRMAGIHTVRWRAGEAASGLYFVVLQAGDRMLARKLLLLK